jgi:phosphate transport system substrate-binding protein
MVITREQGSGVRTFFDEMVTSGNLMRPFPVSHLPLRLFDVPYDVDANSQILTSEEAVLAAVANNTKAIGYVRLSSVDNTVKALRFNGIAPAAVNYQFARPWEILVNNRQPLTPAAQDFFDFIFSTVSNETVDGFADSLSDRGTWTANPTGTPLTGSIIVEGSTSMRSCLEALRAQYLTLGGARVADITWTLIWSGSGGGRTAANNDTNGNIIGLSSSRTSINSFPNIGSEGVRDLAVEAIAVIVHPDNQLTSITEDQLFDIYIGALKEWGYFK